MRDFYEVLGVGRDAAASELKKAYHNLAVKYHPDRNPDDKSAEEMFKEAANAYSVLSNPEQRARYDRFGHEGVRGAGANGAGFSGVEDIFSAFGDIFGDFFGQGRRRAARGADLRVDLTLSFAEAVWGTTKEVRVSREVKCQTCKGSGAKEGTRPETCTTCSGKGQVLHSQGFFMIQTTCPRCRGEGAVIKEACAACQGRRTQVETSTLSVTVPAGVDDGQTLRLAGKGEMPSGGGTAGHLYVVLHVESDERFQREEENITTEVTISYVKAALGGEVEVPTLDEGCTGKTTIEVKPGTQPGDTVVRRGEGVPHINQRNRGDHVVQFAIEIPKKLGAREAELLREIAAERNEDVKGPKRSLFGRAKK
jgi:molecular chaperone DnaJ